MNLLSPAMLLSGAATLLGMRDGTAARDAAIMTLLQSATPTAAGALDLALVHHAGFWSHFNHQNGVSDWPLPVPTDHGDLARFAERKLALSSGRPRPGDLFLVWSPAKERYVHSGIVVSVEPLAHREPVGAEPDDPDEERVQTRRIDDSLERFECHTIEAKVTETGGLGGGRLGRVRRILAPALGDRCIKWADMDIGDRDAQRPHVWSSNRSAGAGLREAA